MEPRAVKPHAPRRGCCPPAGFLGLLGWVYHETLPSTMTPKKRSTATKQGQQCIRRSLRSTPRLLTWMEVLGH